MIGMLRRREMVGAESAVSVAFAVMRCDGCRGMFFSTLMG